MIPVKIDPMSITTISEKGMESIVDWFDQHKQSFYTLGRSYLSNQQQMEELFFRSIIKVQKELPRFKSETSFETWVTSKFIDNCRELSEDRSLQASEESEQHKDLFKALDHLQADEKEALLLTYLKGISQEDTAHLLHISLEKMKALLFSGIQSLRKELGSGPFNGCKEFHKDYIDYLERALDRSKRIDFEIHIYHCQDCQEDLATFQDVMLTMINLTETMEDFQVPPDFMENVKVRLAEKEKHRQQKKQKRKRMGIVFTSVIALLLGIGYFTGTFTNLYYTWTEDNQELRAFLQQGLGERLNLEAESGGIKIRIKSAIADEFQTLVFYEIEDTAADNQYVMDYHDGVSVKNEYEIMRRETFTKYYPPDLNLDVNNKANVYQGKLGLLPLSTDNGTIKLKVTRLQKLIHNSPDRNAFRAGTEMEYEFGDWNFEIPVSKQPSIEYALDEETEIEGIKVRFDKLTIAPTATILKYMINNDQPGKRIEFLTLKNLTVNNKKVKADTYGSSFMDHNMDQFTYQTSFDPLFEKKAKEVNVQFKFAHLTIEDPKTIELDASGEYPQSFEYAGTTISIDKVEVGQPTIVVISNYETENRAYESLNFNIVGENGSEFSSTEMSSDGVFVDKNGNKYDMNDIHVAYEEIEQPRYFSTVQNIQLQSDNAGENAIPKWLLIYGYNTTEYLDDAVKISLE
ncbi:sigma-70 family RNA polymerase sigma factor [Neobacillus sp. NPDC093127]|uniref:sigma-70 family RNA polymerase sigma factor n=1 Tax=Neobacillus sp. NPDC093127 TaxID=3364296 RepID=UPI00382F7732